MCLSRTFKYFYDQSLSMEKEEIGIKFVAKISRSGRKRLINIPAEILKDIENEDVYFKVYLIPVDFKDI